MPAVFSRTAAVAASRKDALVSFELVLHVFANFLGVGNNLVLLTLCAQTVIVRGVAGRFLGLAAEVLCFVLNFVADTHGVFHLSLPVKKLSVFTITQSMLTKSSNRYATIKGPISPHISLLSAAHLRATKWLQAVVGAAG